MWYVYILRCNDRSYYTGITSDLERRLNEHNRRTTGAKYTKTRRPVTLEYKKSFKTRSAALKREAAIKKFSRAQKERLIASRA